MVTVARKTAVRRPAPAAKASPRPAARKAEAPAKPAPAAKKAAAARPLSEAKQKQLAEARAAHSAKTAEAKAAPTKVHPLRQEEVTAHDVVRAYHTARVLEARYLAQLGGDIEEILEFVAPILPPRSGGVKQTPLSRAKVEPEDRVIDEFYDRDDIEKYSIKDLRELAADLAANGVITETKVKSKILAEMEAAGLFREDGSAAADEGDIEEDVDQDAEEDGEEEDGDEESDSDDDEDETEDVVYDRDDLKAMTLKELQELAEANEYDWKGLGKSALIDALLADDEEEEADEDDEDEDEPVEIDPDDLPNMDLSELLELCEQIDLKVPASKKKNKKAVIDLILAELGEDEE